MIQISNDDFIRLANFIKQNYGINLTQKRHIIEGRLSNVILEKGYQTFAEYVDVILSNNRDEIISMLNKVTTNHTYFYRECEHFTYLRDVVLPYLEKTKKDFSLNIWSAACSSGEEPYTLVMIINEYFNQKKKLWDTRILATDVSRNVLLKAQQAQYKKENVMQLPNNFINKYFIEKDDICEPITSVKKDVIFKPFNLMDPIAFKVKFDVIFCRNVMIYFDQNDKKKLVDRLYNATEPGGFLFIGLSENLEKSNMKYKYIMPGVYRKI